jgi:hypothetical protein
MNFCDPYIKFEAITLDNGVNVVAALRKGGTNLISASVEQYIQKQFGMNASAVRDALKRYPQGSEETFLALLQLSRGSIVKVHQMVNDLMEGRKRFVIENGVAREIREGEREAPPRPPLPEVAPPTGSTPVVPSPAIKLNPDDTSD